MPRRAQWRVRVKQTIESWVDVEAVNAVQAETEAAKVPGVVHVFPRSAMRSDLDGERPIRGMVDDQEQERGDE